MASYQSHHASTVAQQKAMPTGECQLSIQLILLLDNRMNKNQECTRKKNAFWGAFPCMEQAALQPVTLRDLDFA